MQGYYPVDSMKVPEGTLVMWESKLYGEEARAKVTLNGKEVGTTWETLVDFYFNDWKENQL